MPAIPKLEASLPTPENAKGEPAGGNGDEPRPDDVFGVDGRPGGQEA